MAAPVPVWFAALQARLLVEFALLPKLSTDARLKICFYINWDGSLQVNILPASYKQICGGVDKIT